MPANTVVRAIREGSALTQNAAARQLGITPGTLAAYEGAHVTPSQSRTWEIARGLALGSPAKGEADPRFLLTYELFGQRFAADGNGRIVVFHDPWVAHEQAERLANAGFLNVALVPIWRSRRRSLVARVKASGEVRGDHMADPIADLISYASRLAAHFDAFQYGTRQETEE